ncbi:hypothetical protein ACFYXF_03325 [Streptomyces sp. NPDC002680]
MTVLRTPHTAVALGEQGVRVNCAPPGPTVGGTSGGLTTGLLSVTR